MPSHLRTVLRIPEGQQEGLRALIGLTPEAYARLVSALKKAPPALSSRKLASSVEAESGIAFQELRQILSVVLSLALTADRTEKPTEELAAEVAEKALEDGYGLTQENTLAFRDRLQALLTIQGSITVSARALGLVPESERIFLGARLLTDMRPIFLGDAPKPVAATIVHTLKIEAHVDGQDQAYFFALDVDDLQSLAGKLNRAIAKQNSLKAAIEKGGLSFVDTNSGPDL